MELYAALYRKEILSHATTWMNLEEIMLNKVSHKNTNTVWFQLYEIPTVVKFIETQIIMVVARVWRKRKNGSCFLKDIEFQNEKCSRDLFHNDDNIHKTMKVKKIIKLVDFISCKVFLNRNFKKKTFVVSHYHQAIQKFLFQVCNNFELWHTFVLSFQ